MFRFLISRRFLINLTIVFFLSLLITCGGYKALDLYTNHGETITVPNLAELTIEEAEELLAQQNLRCKIHDSSFVVDQPPLTIISQNPKALSKVKEDRQIYITINSVNPPKVDMPDLKDVSLEQAKLILESRGLFAGTLTYKPGLGRNTVLSTTFDEAPIKPGDKVFKGSKIGLILANGYGTAEVEVPDLYGLTLSEAEFLLQSVYLNAGGVNYDEEVTDESTAQIYKQIPQSLPDVMLNYGESIDIFLKQEVEERPDTLNINNSQEL